MRRLAGLLVYTVLVAPACARNSGARVSGGRSDAAMITAVLDSTAAGWNRGDLAVYLSAYTPDATEMLKDGPAGGVQAIEKTMREGFWKTGRPEQQLHYEHVLVRMLGMDGAVVTGQYVLTGAGKPNRTGWFTTAWLRTASGWKMVHDAS